MHAPPPHHPPALARKASARPRAAAPMPLSIGDQVIIGGQIFTVGATLIPAGSAPPPPPPPPPPAGAHITGYLAGTPPAPLPAAGVTPGTLLAITGTGFGTPVGGAFGRASIGQAEAPVQAWTDTMVTVVVPNAVPAGSAQSLPVNLYWQASAAAAPSLLAHDGPLLLVLPPPSPPPPPPPPPSGAWHPISFRGPSGQWVWEAKEGDRLTMVGSGFGPAPGRVVFDTTIPVPVERWSDTEIEIVLPHVAGIPHIPYVQVLTADGRLLDWISAGAVAIFPTPARAVAR